MPGRKNKTKSQSNAVPGGPPGGHGMKFDKSIIRRLLTYFKPHRARMIAVCLLILVSAAANVASSLFIRTLIDDYISPLMTVDNPVFTGLLKALAVMGILYLTGAICTLFYNRIMVTVAQGVLKTIRDSMFEHMQGLPVRYFDTNKYGDLMSRFTSDTDTLEQLMTQSIPIFISSVVTIAAVFGSMLYLSVWLTLIVVAVLFLMFRLTKWIGKNSGMYFMRQQKSLGEVNGYIEEMINGQKVIKVFNHEREVERGFDERNDELRRNNTLANTFANILMPVMGSLGYVLYVIIAIAGGAIAILELPNLSLFAIGRLTLGMIGSFLQLSRSFVMPLGNLAQQTNVIAMAMAGAGRVFSLLDEQPEVDGGYVTLVRADWDSGGILTESPDGGILAWRHPHIDGTVTYTALRGGVVFDHVDFSYDGKKQVLHDISLYAEPGQKVAFVGATGAGKTTITNLLNRFYDIADGKIRYDGININKIKKADLRRSLGIVLQDVNLFTGTVMENIRYGRLDATDEECIAAAKLANADSFIHMLPNGYNTMLSGDGSGLSQGQRQLLSIARAAVANPPVMILDEATSSIDTRTEAIVQKGMDALMKGRTVFVIAHRLSTVRNADVIMVLENGRIIERGSHDKLIAQHGRYYQLYTGAFELD